MGGIKNWEYVFPFDINENNMLIDTTEKGLNAEIDNAIRNYKEAYRACLEETLNQFQLRPVMNVSWNDAQQFIRKLNSMNKGKYRFRLPTEAEWEYAARSGGKKEKYAGGMMLMKLRGMVLFMR